MSLCKSGSQLLFVPVRSGSPRYPADLQLLFYPQYVVHRCRVKAGFDMSVQVFGVEEGSRIDRISLIAYSIYLGYISYVRVYINERKVLLCNGRSGPIG